LSRQVLERSLPSNVDAERALLGAVLANNDHFFKVVEALTPDDFYLDGHRVLFRTMVALKEEGVPVDMVTLQDRLIQQAQLEAAGGIGYIASLMTGMPYLTNVEHYTAIVADKAVLRRMITHASAVIAHCFDQADEVSDILESAEQGMFAITSRKVRGSFVSTHEMRASTGELLTRLYNDREMVTGVATGFMDFDRMTSGLQRGDLVIVAARPSMGKTAFGLQLACHAALRRNLTVGFFSMEMSRDQLVLRMLSQEALIDAHKVRTGYISHVDLVQLMASLDTLCMAPLFIDDSASLSIMEMRAKCRRLQAEHGLGLVIVDYLGLMSSYGKAENRTQEVSQISRGLKALAKELNIPVVALAQLSRAPEQRSGDHKPQLSDLRDSGSIEQDADVVAFLYRAEMYKQDEETDGKADLIVAKQRNGPIGTVRLAFLKQYTKFENLLEAYL
jgi:replicative DNA helicase